MNDEMIPTKTYPLSAITGKEIEEEYERGYAQGCEEGKERIAELEAELMMRREQAEGLQNQWVKDTQKIVALEANVKTLRKSGIGLIGILEEILYAVSIDKSCNARVRAIAATLEQQIKAEREGK